MLFGNFWLAFLALFFLSLAESLHVTPDIADEQLRNVYDYIIVGGGTAGLTIANRLSENPAVSALVLEAGPLDDARNLSIPGGLLPVQGTIGPGEWQKYQWGLTTELQTYPNNQNVGIPQGKAVGGSSILNGLCWSRGSVSDYDGWENLGNKGWSWNDLLPYFKKSEKFTFSVEPHDAKELHIRPQSAAHGYNGSVHVSYPQYFYDQSSNVLDGFAELGLPIIGDVNNGTAAGAMILPSSMHPDNQTRFDAREAYFDSASSRYNLHIATNQTVTQLESEGYGSRACSKQQVQGEINFLYPRGNCFGWCDLHSHFTSGIGNWTVRCSQVARHFVKIDLPGIGYNLQDHPMVYANYYYRDESYFRSDEITDDVYDEVAEEYIRNSTAAQKTFSRGTVGPSLSSIFDLPKLDPRYCSDPIDCETIVLGLQMNTGLIQTNAMKEHMPEAESVFDTTDHETLIKHVTEKIATERHFLGTAAMMPLELGGVVDPELKVYGTCNLRIADASIMPLVPSAHLQASVYAIAEKAADMIKSAKPDCRIRERLPFPPRA
ncbi:GMC oxidoreductase [Fusarium acutatum]|uniref:GMC oxidoreductase n=1 Tax=Fusarium acutatum TaxID=78861 RepID=A0A8H4JHB6_9HYPO|nr:GMC oxidoreductase [Fusarium acutatum]